MINAATVRLAASGFHLPGDFFRILVQPTFKLQFYHTKQNSPLNGIRVIVQVEFGHFSLLLFVRYSLLLPALSPRPS
jgi:hypothetical protein